MPTVSLLIGNSDNKLTQQEWSDFVSDVTSVVSTYATRVYFSGFSVPNAPWQNACWVFCCTKDSLESAKRAIGGVLLKYRQDSAAILVGESAFVKPEIEHAENP